MKKRRGLIKIKFGNAVFRGFRDESFDIKKLGSLSILNITNPIYVGIYIFILSKF